jgi:hypothetical protein
MRLKTHESVFLIGMARVRSSILLGSSQPVMAYGILQGLLVFWSTSLVLVMIPLERFDDALLCLDFLVR